MKWFNGRFMRNLLGLVPRLRSCGGPRTRGYTQSGIISEDPLFSTFCVVGFGVAVARVDSEDTLWAPVFTKRTMIAKSFQKLPTPRIPWDPLHPRFNSGLGVVHEKKTPVAL